MKNVYLYVHSHWDREWYREFEEFRLRLIEVVDDVIKKLDKNEIPSFYFDGQTIALQDYLEIYPEKINKIRKLIKENKLFIGPFYCSADSFLCGSEFLIRNLNFGIDYSREFGCANYIGYLADTFGHSISMSKIIKNSGIDNAILWRGLGDLPSEFLWNNLKSTYLIQGYFQDVFSISLDYDKKAELLEKTLDKISSKSSNVILLPCGADHLKIADNFAIQVSEINKRLKNYNLILSNPFEYLEKVKNNYKETFNSELLNQSKNFLLKGVYSSRINQKYKNAVCQWNLSRIAEPFATIATALKLSKDYQNELDYAYKTIIKNHAHDSIYGCSIDTVHEDVENRFKRTLEISTGINKRIIRDFTNSDKLKFLNISNFEYSGCVEVETDKKLDKKYNAQLVSKRKGFSDSKLFNPADIPVTEDIKTIKKYLIEVENLKAFSLGSGQISTKRKNKISDNSIENEFIALKIKNGTIELTDKTSGKIYKNFIKIVDRADVGDSYNFGPLKNDKPIFAKILKSKILTDGHIKSSLRIICKIDIPKTSDINKLKRSNQKYSHVFTMDVSLSNMSKYLEFDLNWNNKSKNHILQVQFTLEQPITNTISEDTIGTIKRDFDCDYNIYDFVPAPRGIELKTNTAPFQRFVNAQDVTIYTKGLNEYEIYKNNLSLTLLRATELISEPKNTSRGTPAGPPLHCPNLQCLGQNNVQFALQFTNNKIEMYKNAETYYGSIIPIFTDNEFDRFINIDNPNIIVNSMKISKDKKGIVLKLVNISEYAQKIELSMNVKYKNINKINLIEDEIELVKNSINVPANDIVAIKIVTK